MPGEDEELAEEKDNPLAEEELPTILKRATVQRPQGQHKRKVALEAEGHTKEEGEMVEEEELSTSVTSATSGGTGPLSALKENRLVKEEHMLLRQRNRRHCLKR